jgi:hypothetical protein
MTAVELILPECSSSLAPDALVDRLCAAPGLRVFDPAAMAALADLSARLLADPAARSRPDLQALGYWLRPAALRRLEQEFIARLPRRAEVVPRGLALLLPPANVETLAVYGWALSLLAGNRSIVRLSGRWHDEVLLRLLQTCLAGHPQAAAVSAFVRTAHDDAVLAALSRRAELRVTWGGDETVAHMRRLPLAPRGLDVGFPDRRSLAAIAVAAYDGLDAAGRDDVADGLANDLFWFDQRACASPSLLLWVGGTAAAMEQAAGDFAPRVAAAAQRRGFTGDGPSRMARLLAIHRAVLDLPVERVAWQGETLAVLRLAAAQPVAAALSGGVVFEAPLPSLTALAGLIDSRVQTLATFGFVEDELRALVRRINGRGLDRIVPIGQALRFDAIWDGVELLTSLTRLVTVDLT